MFGAVDHDALIGEGVAQAGVAADEFECLPDGCIALDQIDEAVLGADGAECAGLEHDGDVCASAQLDEEFVERLARVDEVDCPGEAAFDVFDGEVKHEG